jgi:hypothetical protein
MPEETPGISNIGIALKLSRFVQPDVVDLNFLIFLGHNESPVIFSLKPKA